VNVMSLSEVTASGGEVHMTGNRLEVWLHSECVIECVRQDGHYSIDAVVPTVSQSLHVVGHHNRKDSLSLAQTTWTRSNKHSHCLGTKWSCVWDEVTSKSFNK
jgi:hypothetical protein